jgi:hypothetical protein
MKENLKMENTMVPVKKLLGTLKLQVNGLMGTSMENLILRKIK